MRTSLGGTVRLAEAANLGNNIMSSTGSVHSTSGGGGGGSVVLAENLPLQEHPDFSHLVQRFDSLANKFQDLKTNCDKLVSKEEVHDALKAVVNEIKNIRKHGVTQAVFKEGLKLKADAKELERSLQYFTISIL